LSTINALSTDKPVLTTVLQLEGKEGQFISSSAIVGLIWISWHWIEIEAAATNKQQNLCSIDLSIFSSIANISQFLENHAVMNSHKSHNEISFKPARVTNR